MKMFAVVYITNHIYFDNVILSRIKDTISTTFFCFSKCHLFAFYRNLSCNCIIYKIFQSFNLFARHFMVKIKVKSHSFSSNITSLLMYMIT